MRVTCPCGQAFDARSPRAKFCSDRCRKQASRGGEVRTIRPQPPQPQPTVGTVESEVARELEEAGRLDSALGAQCVALARRIDAPGADTGSAVAAVSKQLTALMAEATRGLKATSPQQLRDELAERRRKHGA